MSRADEEAATENTRNRIRAEMGRHVRCCGPASGSADGGHHDAAGAGRLEDAMVLTGHRDRSRLGAGRGAGSRQRVVGGEQGTTGSREGRVT